MIFEEYFARAKLAIEPIYERFLDRWEQLSLRDQLIASVLALVFCLFLVFIVTVYPVQQKRDRADEQFKTKQELLNWMNRVAPSIVGGGGGSVKKVTSSQGMLQTINQVAGAYEISVKRQQPEGRNKVRVWLDDVPFDKLARWLVELERQHGLAVFSITIDDEANRGIVNVKVVLQGGV